MIDSACQYCVDKVKVHWMIRRDYTVLIRYLYKGIDGFGLIILYWLGISTLFDSALLYCVEFKCNDWFCFFDYSVLIRYKCIDWFCLIIMYWLGTSIDWFCLIILYWWLSSSPLIDSAWQYWYDKVKVCWLIRRDYTVLIRYIRALMDLAWLYCID